MDKWIKMGLSYSHKFGQIIGDLLELSITPHLEKFAKENNLFLDKKGTRKARKGKKVTWIDDHGNKHDLDFVIERNGSETKIGEPIAFIESAWRRYTKHSRNKAQEIQGAIIPLQNKYSANSPFIGVVLAGVFTNGAIKQLESVGFHVLYFSYESVIASFAKYGIDASFNEDTAEDIFKKKIELWEKSKNKNDIATSLFEINKKNVDSFFSSLDISISRIVEQIFILPLHGKQQDIPTISDAISFLTEYKEEEPCHHPINHYEIIIRYSTGDKIEASFKTKNKAILFLKNYL